MESVLREGCDLCDGIIIAYLANGRIRFQANFAKEKCREKLYPADCPHYVAAIQNLGDKFMRAYSG